MTVTSDTDICNSALIKAGASRIDSLEGPSKEAIVCKEQYTKVRDEMLSGHPWNFAIDRVALAATSKTPIPLQSENSFTHEFILPLDVLRVLETDVLFPEQWQVEGNSLLAFQNTINIKYIKRETDVSKYRAYFVEAFATRLAADISFSLVQSAPLTQLLFNLAEQKIREARSFDAQEGQVMRVGAVDFINARR